jgi:hypothetical protein
MIIKMAQQFFAKFSSVKWLEYMSSYSRVSSWVQKDGEID